MSAFRYPIRPVFAHKVLFTHGVFAQDNPVLVRIFSKEGAAPARVLAVVDKGAARAIPRLKADLKKYFSTHHSRVNLVAAPILVPGGEKAKNDWRLVEKLWTAMERHNLSRQSYVIAVGGGAVLDLAGFAAATAHRGIRLVRVPTTSLSQADGGVGVKNGVNYFGKKNWVGAFAVPAAVVNDLDFLATLPPAALRGGVVEAFKVGLIRDRALALWIEKNAAALAQGERKAMERVIIASARRHLRHIATGGDPFEMGSARPLDYGHWVAHKLEQMSGFRLSHGDAVAAGLLIDARYSHAAGWLSRAEAERIAQVLQALGCSPEEKRSSAAQLLLRRDRRGQPLVLAGLEEFRQHLGGALTITLLREWGRGEEVDKIDLRRMRRVVEQVGQGGARG